MSEVLVILLPCTAAMLIYTADPSRVPVQRASAMSPVRTRGSRLLALAAMIAAVVLWQVVEPGPAAFLAVPVTFMASSTVIALLVPALGRRPAASRAQLVELERAAPERRPFAAASTKVGRLDSSGGAQAGTKLARPRAWLATASFILAATVGTLPVALLSAAAVARFLPASPDTRYAIAFLTAIPTWLTAMCLAFSSRSSARSWLWCALAGAVLGAIVFAAPG